MRVHSRIVIDANGQVLEDDFYEYDGPVAECKRGPDQTQTQTNTPIQQPYLQQGFAEAQRLFEGGGPEYFPGSTVIDRDPSTQQAIDITRAGANDPSSIYGQAGQQNLATVRGDYLRPDNPVYQGVLQGVTGAVRPGVDSQFAGAGRFGSGLHAESIGRGITQGMTPFLQSERARQFGAASNVNQLGQQGQVGALSQVGAAEEARAGQLKQEELDRFNFEQNREQQNLAQYMGNLQGDYGGTSEVRQPTYVDPFAKGLGYASSAAGLVNPAK